MNLLGQSLPNRFWIKVVKTDKCWNWIGSRNQKGIGMISWGRKCVSAHTLAWSTIHGEINKGTRLTHTCGNSSCVNPDHIKILETEFCKCGNPRTEKWANCRQCKSKYAAERNRRLGGASGYLSGERRKKHNVRRYTRSYVERGKIPKLPCEVCGSEKSEAHHNDYTKPLEVRWLCLKHHREHHKNEKHI